MIPVTRPYLPEPGKIKAYLDGIYERQWLTNRGPLHQELTRRLEDYLGVSNLVLVGNGTLALQVAYRALNVATGHAGVAEAITTPFTFVATASSLKWEGIQPMFIDVDPGTWCLDASHLEEAITSRTRAVLPVHVFGNPCDIDTIEAIASRHGVKVIFDGAHAFGVESSRASLLQYGDATTLSFHATKVFHCVEGGAIIFRHAEHAERARRLINFGLDEEGDIQDVGINAKMNEFQCAMGLAVLDEMNDNLSRRAEAWHAYADMLKDAVQLQDRDNRYSNNYAYFPILLEDEAQLSRTLAALHREGVGARRYFYPSLNHVACLTGGCGHDLPIAESLSSRVLCLPLFAGVPARHVAGAVLESLRHREALYP